MSYPLTQKATITGSEVKRMQKKNNALQINDKVHLPDEDSSSIKTTPLITEDAINISPETDSKMDHLDLESSKHNSLKINDSDHVPQEDNVPKEGTSSVMITPLVTEDVINTIPETDSEMPHLVSELSCPPEKRKRTFMQKGRTKSYFLNKKIEILREGRKLLAKQMRERKKLILREKRKSSMKKLLVLDLNGLLADIVPCGCGRVCRQYHIVPRK